MRRRNLLFSILTFLILFLALELFVSNLNFRRQHPGQISSAWDKINKKIFTPIRHRFTEDALLKNVDTDGNPWINYPTAPGLRFHPFFDYGRVYTKTNSAKRDYFGFRNDTDLYFSDERDYTLIVMIGGSEAAGFSHTKTIAQNLEKILNSKIKNTQFKVLNLAMNSYVVANEIDTYIHLAYQLKPEYVITHSGSNDITNSL